MSNETSTEAIRKHWRVEGDTRRVSTFRGNFSSGSWKKESVAVVSLCRAAPGVGRSGAPSGADLGCSSEYSIRGCVRMCAWVCGGAFGVSGPPSLSTNVSYRVGKNKKPCMNGIYIWLRTGVWRRFPRQQRLNAGQSVLSQLTRFSELRKLQAKKQMVNQAKQSKAETTPAKRVVGGVCGGVFGETKESASGIDEQADGSKVLCSWRVVGTASLLSRKSESLKWPRKRWVEREQLKAYYSLSDRGVKGV